MNTFKKTIVKILTYPISNVLKNYKVHRKILKLLPPISKSNYNLHDLKIVSNRRTIPTRVFHPDQGVSSKILIFFHGGGWVTGNIDSSTAICANMANQTNYTVISVDYRLAPENKFPKGLEDCYYATREIFINSSLFGIDSNDIVLIGDSAGGNLTAAVSLMARDKGEFLPKKQILVYPSTYSDYSEDSPFRSVQTNGSDYILTAQRLQGYIDMYIAKEDDKYNPYLAPILSEDLSNQPDTLIITAEYDPLRDEGEAYGINLRKFGNKANIYRMKNTIHGFFSMPWNTEYVIKSYNLINWFLDRKL